MSCRQLEVPEDSVATDEVEQCTVASTVSLRVNLICSLRVALVVYYLCLDSGFLVATRLWVSTTSAMVAYFGLLVIEVSLPRGFDGEDDDKLMTLN